MATTAQQVFEFAMDLMDERGADGFIPAGDTAEYRNRTLSILNMLRGELYPYSDSYSSDGEEGRPIATYIKNFTVPIELDDHICQSVMPWGLAAALLVDENPSVASYFQQKYDENKALLQKGLPTVSEDIIDVYGGGFEYNEFGRW